MAEPKICRNCIHKKVCETCKKYTNKILGFKCEHFLSADVVEVVRCKNCANRVEFDTNKFHCELTGYYCGETGYCPYCTPKERGGEK